MSQALPAASSLYMFDPTKMHRNFKRDMYGVLRCDYCNVNEVDASNHPAVFGTCALAFGLRNAKPTAAQLSALGAMPKITAPQFNSNTLNPLPTPPAPLVCGVDDGWLAPPPEPACLCSIKALMSHGHEKGCWYKK